MNLTSPATIKELLSKYQTRPSKGLGQNFLIDQHILGKIIAAANIQPSDTIVEIGPGVGTLTQALATRAEQVIAIEKDKTMIAILGDTLKEYQNIKLVEGDALRHDYSLLTTNYKLVANIPYYLTSALIRKFLENPPNDQQPESIVLLIQKEVAQRICAKPPEMSLLSVAVQYFGTPEIISYVSKNCFLPAPKVDSAIIKISNIKKVPENTKTFFKIVKAGFSQPRKQLGGNLTKQLKKNREEVNAWLTQNHIDPTQRAETLSLQDWHNLADTY